MPSSHDYEDVAENKTILIGMRTHEFGKEFRLVPRSEAKVRASASHAACGCCLWIPPMHLVAHSLAVFHVLGQTCAALAAFPDVQLHKKLLNSKNFRSN